METTQLPDPWTEEDAELELSLLDKESTRLSASLIHYLGAANNIEKRLLALNKKRHAIQAWVTVGVTKVRKRKPKPVTPEEYLASLTPTQLSRFIADSGITKEEIRDFAMVEGDPLCQEEENE